MRETLEALSSLGFSVGQPEMAPQSEPKDRSHNVQGQMSSSSEERALGTSSGHEAPGPEEGAQTEQAEAPSREGQACTPQKAEPVGSCSELRHLKRITLTVEPKRL
uniref:Zinc finger protein 467 n=1 Tax=Urocitellus parryii TaxID=9999 RepID=A0A8D2IHJ1_UROPR